MCNNDVVQVDGQPNYVARFGIVFAKQAWISGIVNPIPSQDVFAKFPAWRNGRVVDWFMECVVGH